MPHADFALRLSRERVHKYDHQAICSRGTSGLKGFHVELGKKDLCAKGMSDYEQGLPHKFLSKARGAA